MLFFLMSTANAVTFTSDILGSAPVQSVALETPPATVESVRTEHYNELKRRRAELQRDMPILCEDARDLYIEAKREETRALEEAKATLDPEYAEQMKAIAKRESERAKQAEQDVSQVEDLYDEWVTVTVELDRVTSAIELDSKRGQVVTTKKCVENCDAVGGYTSSPGKRVTVDIAEDDPARTILPHPVYETIEEI